MRLSGDDRAVTVQIGAVILLGFLVISLSLYQATVVPNENRQIEFQHNQRVQSDMLEVRNAILGTAATGSAAPATVELGTQYPTRTVAVNPSPPSGTLSTSSLGNISVKNATADDATTSGEDYPETADFWNGTTRNYTTSALEYRPSYANYDGAPTTVYENGIVYNRFNSGNITRSGQPVVAGTRISLVALDGELSRGGSSSLLVDPRAVSVSTRTVSITNASATENVSVVVPSELDAQGWTDLLNETGDYDPAADPTDGAYVYRVEDRPNGVELYFESGTTYQLKLSKIGVGSNVDPTEPAYLTSVEDLTSDPFTNRNYTFAVESRDKYNNPVSTGVTAAADRTAVPNGLVAEPGRYRYQYPAPGTAGGDVVRVSYLDAGDGPEYDVTDTTFEGEEAENVEYAVDVQSAPGGTDAAGRVEFAAVTQRGNNGEFEFEIENTGESRANAVRFALNGSIAGRVEANGNNPELVLNDTEADAAGNGDGGSYLVDGKTYDFTTISDPAVGGGATETVVLDRLRDGGSTVDTRDLEYAPGSSASEAELVVTLEFEDGSQRTFYFEVP